MRLFDHSGFAEWSQELGWRKWRCLYVTWLAIHLLRIFISNNQRLRSAFDDLDPRLFAKLVMMPSAPAKSAGDARYASQDPFVDRWTVPYVLDSNLYKDCVLCTSNVMRHLLELIQRTFVLKSTLNSSSNLFIHSFILYHGAFEQLVCPCRGTFAGFLFEWMAGVSF